MAPAALHGGLPDAESPMTNAMDFGPEWLCVILRKANGREIVMSYPGQAQGVLDGYVYIFREAE